MIDGKFPYSTWLFTDKSDVEIFVQLRSRQCHTGVSPLTLDAIKMTPQFLLSHIYITSYNRFLQWHRKCCCYFISRSIFGVIKGCQKKQKRYHSQSLSNPNPVRSRGFFEGTNGKVFPNDIFLDVVIKDSSNLVGVLFAKNVGLMLLKFKSAGLAGVSSGMGLDDGLLVCTLLLLI